MLFIRITQKLFFRGACWGNFNYCNCIAIGHTEIALVEVLYSTANDPQPQMIPRPQMILDRKWSLKSTVNDPVKTWGMEWILWDWLQKRTDYKKRNLFLAPSKEKEKEDATSQVNLYKAKKKVE